MRKTLVLPVAVALLVVAAACSGKKSGPPLSSGTYTVSNGQTVPNDCQLNDLSQLDGSTITVSVAGSTVTLPDLALDLTLSGDTLSAPQIVEDIDWSTSAGQAAAGVSLSRFFNCVQHDTTDPSGSVLATNSFHLDRDVHYTMVSGSASECIAADNSAFGFALTVFPCESKLSFDAAM